MIVVLYDIHGNLPALEAVLDEARTLEPEGWLLGGDYGLPSPWPNETLALLRELPSATWIRGNGERWLYDPPDDPELVAVYDRLLADVPEEDRRALFELPERAERGDVLFVHGSPLSDVESFSPEADDDDSRLLAGEHDRTIVFGHSHQQFRRAGPAGTTLVNPGSVGMPLDRDTRAAWATWAGDFELRRTEYDVARAAAAFRALGGDVAEWMAGRLERGYDV